MNNCMYEVVREYLNKKGLVEDFTLEFRSTNCAKSLDFAVNLFPRKDEQISIVESDEATDEMLHHWIINKYYKEKK